MALYITQEELTLMSESIRIITLELAMRFLKGIFINDLILGLLSYVAQTEREKLRQGKDRVLI